MLIIFDLDDTLIDSDGCILPTKFSDALKSMINAGLKVNFDEAFQLIEKIDQTSGSGKETLTRFLKEINADSSFLKVGLKEYYENINVSSINMLDGANEVLEFLKEKNQLALVTKGIKEQQLIKIQKSGINSNFFNKIIIVEQGSKKEYYQKVLEELNYTPSQAYACGDSFVRDLLPAKELGIKTILMCWGRGKKVPPDETEIDYCISELKEIKNII